MDTVTIPAQRLGNGGSMPYRTPDRDWRMVGSRLDPEDHRPRDYVFSNEEIRDRFMRYGGVDAATAWQMVGFVRYDNEIDWQRIFDATGLTFGVME